MGWQKENDEIAARRKRAQAMGGEAAVQKQHARGRLTVRQRLNELLDAESFREFGALAGSGGDAAKKNGAANFLPANVVAGTGRVNGRAVVAAGDDFTIGGGAYTPAALRKNQYAEQLAIARRVPLLRLLEGGGARISGGYGRRGHSGYDLTQPPPLNLLALEALAAVPVVCAALGPCAGFPAARLAAAHFSTMTPNSVVLTGGPKLVERALGKSFSKQQLGGPEVHLRSGVVDNLAANESDALAQMRRFLSYLPQNAWQAPPTAECTDPPARAESALQTIIPREGRRAYKIRRLIELVVDRGSFFETAPQFGRDQLTGLARAGGRTIGVLANDCAIYGGGMSANGARKVRRFVEMCDTFNLPVLSLVDEPGFQIGPAAESAGTIRYGMEAMFAALQSAVPWFCVVLRRSFGVAQGIHFGRQAHVVAWPSMQSGALPVESGVALAFAREIAAAPNPAAHRAKLEREMQAAQSAFPRAEEFGVHDLIPPQETRPRLCEWRAQVEAALPANFGPRRYTARP